MDKCLKSSINSFDNKINSSRKIQNFDAIRVISALGIVIYHFSYESKSSFKLLYRFANGGWGNVFNTIFFILSGAVCYYRYSSLNTIENVKLFYTKRWKSIFPMFYMVWIHFYIRNCLIYNTLFYSKKFILTLVGLDGYFYYLGDNYYIIGEWFLGAIILLYILYPLILLLFKCIPKIVMFISFALYIFSFVKGEFFKISDSRNLLSCLFCFLVGMVFVEHIDLLKKEEHKVIALFIHMSSLFISIVLIFIPTSINRNFAFHILGMSMFIILFFIGGVIARHNILYKIVAEVGKLTYPTFLLHHQIIFEVTNLLNPSKTIPSILLLLVILVKVAISSKCLLLLYEWLTSTICLFKEDSKSSKLF